MSTRTKVNEPSSKQFNCSWHGETHVCRNGKKNCERFSSLWMWASVEMTPRNRFPRARTERRWKGNSCCYKKPKDWRELRERETTHTQAGDVEMTWNYLVQSNHKSPPSVLFLVILPFTLANYPCDGFTFFPVKNKHVFKLFCSVN